MRQHLPRYGYWLAALCAINVAAVSNLVAASTQPLTMVPIDRKHLPQAALQEGSLTDPSLHAEAHDLVVRHLQQFGCHANTLNSYLLKLPYGNTGERRWQELWQANGCGDGTVSAKLTFQERSRQRASITLISDSDE